MQLNTIFYIVAHNIALINHFESIRKYEKMTNYKYLLVGDHKENYGNDEIIQCNLLPDNIEKTSNNYLAYTAWYAVAKNANLTSNYDYICFLEYDTDVDENFDEDVFVKAFVNKNVNCCGLSYMHTHSGIFQRTQFTSGLLDFLKSKDIRELKPNKEYWITTNNVIFSKHFLLSYFNDTLTVDLFEFLKNDKMSGHFLERYLSVYCFIRNISFDTIEGSGLVHRGLDSHSTQGIHSKYEQFKVTNKISD